ncbi:MAG: mechanosensitive ion channel family protein [Kiritimatiellae bacterium]|nr:mechanosensitive ion channel family protein [Kiritimatiellia bacterium]
MLAELISTMAPEAADTAAKVAEQTTAAVESNVAETKTILDTATQWLTQNGMAFAINVLWALIILLVGWIVIKVLCATLRKTLDKTPKINPLLKEFFISIARKSCWVLLLMLALRRLGIDIAPLIAGLGVTGFILGFAFQESLGNLASGVMIAINQPFNVGDYVNIGGNEGSVLELNMMAVTIATADNKKVVVPNKVAWGAPITNFAALGTRRVEVTIGIAYGEDIGKAREVILSAVKANPLVLQDPAPIAEVVAFKDSAVVFAVRPWSKSSDYWSVYFQVGQQVKEALDKAGIKIPLPQLEVRNV